MIRVLYQTEVGENKVVDKIMSTNMITFDSESKTFTIGNRVYEFNNFADDGDVYTFSDFVFDTLRDGYVDVREYNYTIMEQPKRNNYRNGGYSRNNRMGYKKYYNR